MVNLRINYLVGLVCQVATCRFLACVYRRRSFYRIFNALTIPYLSIHLSVCL